MSGPSPKSVSATSTVVDIDTDFSIDMENVSLSGRESQSDDNDWLLLTVPFVAFDRGDEIENEDKLVTDSDLLEEGTNDEEDVLIVKEKDDFSENLREEFSENSHSIPEQGTFTAGLNLTVAGEEERKTYDCEQKLISPSSCEEKQPAEDDEGDVESGQTCVICLDVLSNSGAHRLSSLKCGHLFGHSCMVRWLQDQRRCPQCNVIDMMENHEENNILRKKLEESEKEMNQLKLILKLQARQLQDLEAPVTASATIANHNSVSGKSSVPHTFEGTGNINLLCENGEEICKDGQEAIPFPGQLGASQPTKGSGNIHLTCEHEVKIFNEGCGVLAYSDSLNLLVTSRFLNGAQFSGYGISMIQFPGFQPTQYIKLHTEPIQDLAISTSENKFLLSVSLDKFVKLIDFSCNKVVYSIKTDTPLWSCCWDMDNSNIFFVGGQNGCVIQYDTRKAGAPVSQISRGDNEGGVTSIASVPSNPGGTLPRGGFIACHLNSCWAYEKLDSDYCGKKLNMNGPFFSMRYDRQTDHILTSMPPSPRSICARHAVCKLDRTETNNSLMCKVIDLFEGSLTQRVISRPCQMKIAGYGSVVASYVESSSSIEVWNLANGNKVCSHPVSEVILDTCPINVDQKQYLGTVSDKTLRVYRVVLE